MNPLAHKLCYCEGCKQKVWTNKDGIFVRHVFSGNPLSNPIPICPYSGKAPGKQEDKRKGGKKK